MRQQNSLGGQYADKLCKGKRTCVSLDCMHINNVMTERRCACFDVYAITIYTYLLTGYVGIFYISLVATLSYIDKELYYWIYSHTKVLCSLRFFMFWPCLLDDIWKGNYTDIRKGFDNEGKVGSYPLGYTSCTIMWKKNHFIQTFNETKKMKGLKEFQTYLC